MSAPRAEFPPTTQKVLSIQKLVELLMLDFRNRMRTSISILTSAAGDVLVFFKNLTIPPRF